MVSHPPHHHRQLQSGERMHTWKNIKQQMIHPLLSHRPLIKIRKYTYPRWTSMSILWWVTNCTHLGYTGQSPGLNVLIQFSEFEKNYLKKDTLFKNKNKKVTFFKSSVYSILYKLQDILIWHPWYHIDESVRSPVLYVSMVLPAHCQVLPQTKI